jgi:hypothetical protein
VICGVVFVPGWGSESDQWRGVCAWVGERKRSVSMGGRAVAISDMVFLRVIAMKGGDYNFCKDAVRCPLYEILVHAYTDMHLEARHRFLGLHSVR